MKSPGERALDLLEKLADYGSWYSSAIELDMYDIAKAGAAFDGETLREEADAILIAAGRSAE